MYHHPLLLRPVPLLEGSETQKKSTVWVTVRDGFIVIEGAVLESGEGGKCEHTNIEET